jgi:tRNA(fMet)-specific endonuclease VapC
MVCLDTTFVADLLRRNSDAEKKLNELAKGNDDPCITIITIAELFYGAYKSKNAEKEKNKIRQVLDDFPIFEMDEHGAEKFGEILTMLEKAGQRISDRDIMIAAIALSRGEKFIVTRNKKDFQRIPDLTIITY